MRYSYSKLNPYNELKLTLIVDETHLINSPLYLHVFEDERSKKYGVITEYIGIPLPYVFENNCLVFGTSNYIYCYDTVLEIIKYEIQILSPSQNITKFKNILIIMCECDILIVSTERFKILNEFNFNDVISDYNIYSEDIVVELMSGEKVYLHIDNSNNVGNTGDGPLC